MVGLVHDDEVKRGGSGPDLLEDRPASEHLKGTDSPKAGALPRSVEIPQKLSESLGIEDGKILVKPAGHLLPPLVAKRGRTDDQNPVQRMSFLALRQVAAG